MDSAEITNVWQFLAFAMIAGLPAVAGLAKHWINKSEKKEEQETEKRKEERDKEFGKLKHELKETKTQVTGLGNSFDEHKKEHKEKDDKLENQLAEQGKRIQNIEANLIERREFLDLQKTVHSVDKSVAEVAVILKERARAVGAA